MKPHPTSGSAAPPRDGIIHRLETVAARIIPDDLILLCARLFPAAVFWLSGRTKMDGFDVSDGAVFLFEHEYALPLLDPELAARMAAFAEHLFPVMLVMGLGTRLAALALLGMTLVIQVFVYPGAWVTHGLWATCFLLLIARGGGRFALDHAIGDRRRSR